MGDQTNEARPGWVCEICKLHISFCGCDAEDFREHIAELRAEVEALKAGAALVKPLEWKPHWTHGETGRMEASTFGGLIEYQASNEGWWFPLSHMEKCAGIDVAKAAAQADYEARILAAIEQDPAALNRARAEVLREMADRCDVWHRKALERAEAPGLSDVDLMNHEVTASTACSLAHEIRARAAEVEEGK